MIKVFKDLEFKQKDNFVSVQARMKFDNGFSISVVAGKGTYSSPRENNTDPDFFSEFEVAVFAPNGDFATKDFIPDHYDDVLGWQERGQINALMLLIQAQK